MPIIAFRMLIKQFQEIDSNIFKNNTSGMFIANRVIDGTELQKILK